MSRLVKMLPVVCVVCMQTWQAPDYIVAKVNKDNPYKCPYCRDEPWRDATTDSSEVCGICKRPIPSNHLFCQYCASKI